MRRLTGSRLAYVAATTAVVVAAYVLVPTYNRLESFCAPPSSGALQAAGEDRVELGVSPGFSILEEPVDQLRDDLDALVTLGVTRLRVDVSWAVLQPGSDRFDWSSTDRVMGEARARGIDVLGVLGYEPDWARRTTADGTALPVDPQAFAAFAGLAADRYAEEVGAWEIWNEPNISRFWPTGPDPVAYAEVVAAASPLIRAAAPGATILVGALSPADDGADALAPATFVTGLYDTLDPDTFDALSVHPYTYPASASGSQSWNTFHRLEELHRIMARHGDGGSPIWLTEFGAPTGTSEVSVSEQDQAEQLTTGIEEARQRCYTGPLYVYSLRDAGTDPADPEDNFGLLRADGTPKPAYAAVAEAAGASPTGP